jgi:predicted nucleic acid-binding protein
VSRRSSFALDTNCIVAAVCSWHEHHDAATNEIERRFALGERLHVPAPAIVEAYAVLTRLPPPFRLSPSDAWALIEANFVSGGNVVALDASAYVDTLRLAVKSGIAGGRAYDAVIGQCASSAAVDILLTFNVRHFDPPPVGVRVVEPSAH